MEKKIIIIEGGARYHYVLEGAEDNNVKTIPHIINE